MRPGIHGTILIFSSIVHFGGGHVIFIRFKFPLCRSGNPKHLVSHFHSGVEIPSAPIPGVPHFPQLDNRPTCIPTDPSVLASTRTPASDCSRSAANLSLIVLPGAAVFQAEWRPSFSNAGRMHGSFKRL